ncbi:MAG: hypothetical protein IPF55_01350 [Rhodoferax sp.]|nr:hypothetical protein [Rhodoferax sp.]
MSVRPESLKRFLVTAKQATYAATGGGAAVAPLLPDSKQLEFAEGELLYRDIYVGTNRFVGLETVYLAGRAIWAMSYAGGLSADVPTTDVGTVYAFLRQALRALPSEQPLRGPPLFEQGTMRYTCQCIGSISGFSGIEAVSAGDSSLYQLHFAGGLIT